VRLVHLAFALALFMQSLALAGPVPASGGFGVGIEQGADCGQQDDGLPAPHQHHQHTCLGCSHDGLGKLLGAPGFTFVKPHPRIQASVYHEAYCAPGALERRRASRARAPPMPV
jgi:hypothetical protein